MPMSLDLEKWLIGASLRLGQPRVGTRDVVSSTQVNPDIKLPVLYLVDSIIKNVGGAYTQKFSQIIVNMFTRTFKQVIIYLNILNLVHKCFLDSKISFILSSGR